MRFAVVPLGAAAIGVIVLSPLTGMFPVVRLSAVLAPLLLVGALGARPFSWRAPDWERLLHWQPSRRAVLIGATTSGILLGWIVLTRFFSAEINGVDFTIYFDRPLYQTAHGRPLFVETTDDPRFAQLTHLAVHAYWLLLPLSALYLLHATPIWLLALSVLAPVVGAVHVLRIGQRLRFGGLLSVATAVVFLFNDNTARALNYGFHPEILYCWFVPWLLHAALRGARRSFLVAVVLCVLVKEDALFPLLASSIALALTRGREYTTRERLLFLVAPPALALANLAIYYSLVVPALAPGGQVMYSYFWDNYGATPIDALGGMLARPWQVVASVANSGLLRHVLLPYLFLPLIGWRWAIGTLPLVLVYSASAAGQVRDFGIYYSIVLVPFYTIAAAQGARTLANRVPRPALATGGLAFVMVIAALAIGNGYSLRPWKPQVAAMSHAMAALADERVVLVQSGLYPHAGYDARVKILTHATLDDPSNHGAALLLAEEISTYPLGRQEWEALFSLPQIADLPAGMVAVRLIGPETGTRSSLAP